MTPPAEFTAIRTAVKQYNDEWTKFYKVLRSLDLRTASLDELTDLRKACAKTELYARAVSDRIHDYVVSLEGN